MRPSNGICVVPMSLYMYLLLSVAVISRVRVDPGEGKCKEGGLCVHLPIRPFYP